MQRQHRYGAGVITSGLLLGMGAATLPACDPDALSPDKIAQECGLDIHCTAGGFAEGKASISGEASIDAFFGAAIDLNAAMVGLSAQLRGQLDAIGASVGLAPGATGADLETALKGHLAGYIEGNLTIDYQPAQCQASVEAAVSAAAECDVAVDPGEVSAQCSGSCQAQVDLAADCGADADLMCSGTAPELACDGTCSGSCVADFSTAARCDGTCRGSCKAGNGPATDGFEGKCDGDCEGQCAVDLSAGGTCMGKCEGNCEYVAPQAGCEGTATAHCEAHAGAAIECDAGCQGTVEPPSVSAECEATVQAKATASVQCTPPTLAFGFAWAAGVQGDLAAQAEFRAWLEGFRGHFGAMLAARAQAEAVGGAALNLAATAEGTLLDAVTTLSTEGDLKAKVGATCALKELTVAGSALADAQVDLAANVQAAVTVVGAF